MTASQWPPARKFAWIEQLGLDPALSALALRVALRLATKYVNSATGDAWPSQDTLRADLDASENGIRKAAAQLADRGHLDVRAGRGKGVSTRYRPLLKPLRAERLSGTKPPPPGDLFDEVKTPPRGVQNPSARIAKTPPPGDLNPCDDSQRGIPVRERTRRRAAERPLPDDCPSERQIIWAQDRFSEDGLQVDAGQVAEAFRSRAQAKDTRWRDWSAAWRNWVGNEIKFAKERAAGRRTQPGRRLSGLEYAAEVLSEQRRED